MSLQEMKFEPHEELWSAQQVADYLGYSRNYFINKVSKWPDFPKEKRAGRRWLRSEIVEWATSD